LLILGWTVVEYMLQSQIQYQYQQLSTYPVMVYSWDREVMDSLKADIPKLDYIREIVYKTGEESALEMIKKYGLSGTEDILEDSALPDMMIIYLKGNAAARANKLILKERLEKSPERSKMMVEYQNDIWDISFKRIDQWNQIRWILIGFIGIVIFLVFLLKRLHYEHHLARIRHLVQTRQAEAGLIRDHFWGNTFLLCFLPVGISYLLYQVFYYSDWLLYGMKSYFFLIELGVILAASLVAYPFEVKYRHEEPPLKEEL
jgi:hypothetical protein